MDYEIGHINMSAPADKSEVTKKCVNDDDAIVGWHRDSYPFVCVLMMSDTTGMVGGETALRTGSGEVRKVRGPSKVCAPMSSKFVVDSVPGLRRHPPRPLH